MGRTLTDGLGSPSYSSLTATVLRRPLAGFVLCLAAGLLTAWPSVAHGQTRRVVWGYRSPADAMAARIHAQAELVRASGEATVNAAQARDIRARAVQQEIANSVERVKAVWERRSIAEAERLHRAYDHLESQKRRNSKTWDRLHNHPELNGPSITNGNALNFLLHRLSGTLLAYKFTLSGDQRLDPELKKQLTLNSQVLHGLSLRQNVGNGEQYVFRADEGIALNTGWWPFLLRDATFDRYRQRCDEARRRVAADARNGTISHAALKELDAAVLELYAAFGERSTWEKRTGGGFQTWRSYHTAELFLKSLIGEVGRLQSTGDAAAFDGSLAFAGDDLVALLTHMSRNGLDFAPATPGDEAAYHALFAMMRDLYVMAADDDESIRPTKERYTR